MGIFKKFKKAVKTGIKGAGKVAKKHPAFRLGSAVSKVVRKKSRTRNLSKFFGSKVAKVRRAPKKRTRKLPRPPIKGRKALKGRATGTVSPLRRRRRTRSK
ncbi:hypothetical protein LCGC14_2600430 [marine sediment metagenome]|uniref:Uncharacterized protein n=1 Tax=marine sediment metagenome TaxID=412755 RepID=A0A0F9CJV1_9ZZZZ